MKHGVPVRIYVFVTNDQDEVLVSPAGLPKADFIAGKDFKDNVAEVLRTGCGVKASDLEPAGIGREFGATGAMVVGFWASDISGEPSEGWSFQSPAAAKHSLPEFDGTFLETCVRARPAVAVA